MSPFIEIVKKDPTNPTRLIPVWNVEIVKWITWMHDEADARDKEWMCDLLASA